MIAFIAFALAATLRAPGMVQSVAVIAVQVAPADEYFGRMQMSILGIKNELLTLRNRALSDPRRAERVFGMASMVEDAIRAWQNHFPEDPWLATDLRRLVEVYIAVPTPNGIARAHRALAWLLRVAPTGSDTDRAIREMARQRRHR